MGPQSNVTLATPNCRFALGTNRYKDSVPTVGKEMPSAVTLEDKPNRSHFLGGAPGRLQIRKPARFPGTSARVGPAEKSHNP